MSERSVLFTIENGLATITLNRPDSANAMDLALMRELQAAAHECETNGEIRAVLLTAAGKMFSAGGDLSWFGQHMDSLGALLREATFYLHDAIKRFAEMQKPLVVAVNGAAAGAGFSLAILGDYKLAARSSSYCLAYTAAGLSPDGGSSYFLPRLVGETRAKELMLTNRRLSAVEALDWGLVNEVVDDEQLQERAEAMSRRLASGPTCAYGTVKQLLNVSSQSSLAAQLDREALGIAGNGMRSDGQEGITAFLSKRKPQFEGR